jgi:DNA topoisomerase-1
MAHPPERVRPYLTRDQNALYTLIWNRFVACQMKPAVYASTQVRIEASAGGDGTTYELRVTGSRLEYPGWLAVEETEADRRKRKKKAEEDTAGDGRISSGGLTVEDLPALAKGDPLRLLDPGVEAQQKFTKPPPRFSEGSLIKELEEQGIGRPSTYATIISTIQDRRYVKKYQQRFMPTPLGEIVIDRLRSHFPDILDIDFTAKMEQSLDAIEAGKVQWSELLEEFYGPFHETVLSALKNMKNGVDSKEYEKFSARGGPSSSIEVDLTCEKCSRPMVLRTGRYGEFLSCSGFPKCRESRPVHTGVACPREGCEGVVEERRSKRGRKFYGCSKHEQTGCDFVTWAKPVKKRCPKCEAPFLVIKRSRGATFLRCLRDDCDYSEEIAL